MRPHGLAAAFIGFGAVLTAVSDVAGVLVSGVGLLLQCAVFILDGAAPPPRALPPDEEVADDGVG